MHSHGSDRRFVTARRGSAGAQLCEVSRGATVKPDQDAGSARAGQRLHLIGYLLDDPQTVAVLAGQRIHRSPVRGAARLDDRDAIVVTSRPGGHRQITVVNLAIQGSGQVPYPQSSRSAAMADGVRRQLMHGQDHVLGSAFREPRATDAGSHLCPHRMQRARIKPQIKDRWCAVGGYRCRPVRIDPAARSGRSVGMKAIRHKQPEGSLGRTP
jgi:hypothetical protein